MSRSFDPYEWLLDKFLILLVFLYCVACLATCFASTSRRLHFTNGVCDDHCPLNDPRGVGGGWIELKEHKELPASYNQLITAGTIKLIDGKVELPDNYVAPEPISEIPFQEIPEELAEIIKLLEERIAKLEKQVLTLERGTR